MTIDNVYQLCPCGSGKKLKFCCLSVADEMNKVIRQLDNGQTRMAVGQMSRIAEAHPDMPWPRLLHATVLLQENEPEGAREQLRAILELSADHLLGIALMAIASVEVDGYSKSRAAVYKAFQKCSSQLPDPISGLAMAIAETMFVERKYISARQHYALAMRLARDEDKQSIFLKLLQFDSDNAIPYPLRSVHHLEEFSGTPEERKESVKAAKLAAMGCFQPAARLFQQLLDAHPESGALAWNTGLCHAWDGNEKASAQALHTAARLWEDREQAIECETIAQLLDQNSPENSIDTQDTYYTVESVSRLLTTLDGKERLARQTLPPADPSSGQRTPDAVYLLLDRPEVEVDQLSGLQPADVPNVLAQVIIFDAPAGGNDRASVGLIGLGEEGFENARSYLQEAAGDQLVPDSSFDDEAAGGETIPAELFPLYWRWSLPPRIPGVQRRELELQQWQQLIDDVWPDSPLHGLGGKTPREAIGQAELSIPLAAAIYVLDAFGDRSQYVIDVPELMRKFELPEPARIEPAPDLTLSSFSSMQLHRLPLTELSDDQVSYALNRALLIHHSGFLYDVLIEVLKRTACVENVELPRVYQTLSDLARDRNRIDEALEWIQKGMEERDENVGEFEHTLRWKLRELALRLERPDDPELRTLLAHMWSYYGRKLPQLRARLTEIVASAGIEPPWDPEDDEIAQAAGGGTTSAGGIWTPGQESSGEGQSKLWLPDQS